MILTPLIKTIPANEREVKQIQKELNLSNNIFTKSQYLQQLMTYYHSKNDGSNYMFYDKLFLDLEGVQLYQLKFARNYLISQLAKRKQQDIENFETRLRTWSVLISLIFITIIGIVLYYCNENQVIKKKNKLIPDKTEMKILEKLHNFETSEKYLDTSISISSLAKDLDTNVKYLSAVLNNQKQKSFNMYINELRIRHIAERLKNDRRYRTYKISYLATICGFISQSSFSSFFKSIVGMTASAYINKLNDAQTTHYLAWARSFFNDVQGNIGFVKGKIFHYWHGHLADRQYSKRYEDLSQFDFDPSVDVSIDNQGCFTWSSDKSALHDFVRNYWNLRKEDGPTT